MTTWEDAQEVLQLVKNHVWIPAVFERCRNSELIQPCIFNLIRQELSTDEYEQWDDAYCLYYRPQDKELIEWLRAEHKQKERQVREEWKSKEIQLLMKKKQLLKRKLQM